MPIYEYRCSECGHQFEALQRLADAPLLECPACGKKSLTKLLSAVGFHLKGSGWYATDFKHSGSKPADKAAKSGTEGKSGEGTGNDAQGEASASSTEKSDAKPAAPASSESKTTSTDSKPSAAAPAKPAATGS